MAAPTGTKPIQGQMSARGTTVLSCLEGPIMLAYGSSELRFTGVIRNVVGSFRATPRYRKFAVRPEAPEEASITNGTNITTSDTSFSQDLSLSGLGSYMFIQPIMGGSVAPSSGDAGEALGYWQAWTDTEARIVARQTIEQQSDVNSTKKLLLFRLVNRSCVWPVRADDWSRSPRREWLSDDELRCTDIHRRPFPAVNMEFWALGKRQDILVHQ
jgi:hypothetical protein